MSKPTNTVYAAALSAAAFLVLPTDVPAQQAPFTARGLVAPTVGQSVFSDTPVTRTAMRYELAAGAKVDAFTTELAFGFTHFLHDRGERVASVVAGDVAIGGSYTLPIVGPLSLLPRVDVVLPASKYSRDLSLVFASHIGVDAVLKAGPVKIVGRTRLRRDVHESDVPPRPDVSPAEYRDANPGPFGFRTAGSRLLGREDAPRGAFRLPAGVVIVGVPNTAWATHLGLDATGDIAAGFYADVGFGWTHTWTYALERPANVVVSDDQPRRLQLNINTGTVGVGWKKQAGAVEFGLRLGLATTGWSRTADDERQRFPFWNFEDASYDDSVLDLRVTARY